MLSGFLDNSQKKIWIINLHRKKKDLLLGFNVVDYDKKIDVSRDNLSIYVYLSHSLSGIDFDDMSCSGFYCEWKVYLSHIYFFIKY
jgi:hypothetical protein